MAKIIKVNPIGLSKLNNAEYTNLAVRTNTLIQAAGAEALGIDEADLARYQLLIAQMNEQVAQSRICDETAEMQTVDKERCSIGVFLLAEVRVKRTSPISAHSSAAVHLFNQLKPYVGFQRFPGQQKTVKISGMLKDLAKEAYQEDVVTLQLADLIASLSAANAKYQILTDQRTASREAAKLENSKVVREEMDELYDTLTTLAFVQSVAAPTEVTANFITALNAVIAEVTTAYNQRIAQLGKKTDEETSEQK